MFRLRKAPPFPPPAPVARRPLLELLLGQLSSLLWVLLAFVVVIAFHGPLRDLLGRATRLKLPSVEIEAAAATIDRGAERLRAIPGSTLGANLSPDDPRKASLVQRWEAMGMSGRRVRLLLIHDDHPVAYALREPFADLGFEVDLAVCGPEAWSLLRRHMYDVVVSDIDWSHCQGAGNPRTAGVDFLKRASDAGLARPTIFYSDDANRPQALPPEAIGVTANWFEVLHRVLDVLARQPSPGVRSP